MIKARFALTLIMVGFISICDAQRIKTSSTYFHSPSKVRIIVATQIGYFGRTGSSGLGLLGGVLSTTTKPSGGKYQAALDALEPTLNPTEKVKEFYKNLFIGFGKNAIIIDEKMDPTVLVDFKSPKGSGKKYYEKDIRFLKDKYQVDNVLLVGVNYGVRSIYSYGVVEQNRRGMASINTEIVDVSDNSYIVTDGSQYWEKIDGDWDTPPAYENLKKSIAAAIDNGLSKEKERYK